MKDEKDKELSLSDLGIEQEETPAQKAEEENKKNNKKKGKKQETKPVVTNKDGVVSGEVNSNAEEHFVSVHKKNKVVRPDIMNNTTRSAESDYSNFETVKNVNDIAVNPIKKKPDFLEESYKKKTQTLYELADAGIERTEKELTKPGGRIDYAKREYVRLKYDQLMERAKTNKSLSKKIKALQQFMDTDSRFDDISEYERKGYTIFNIAHDDKVETNDDYFGLTNDAKAPRFRNSHDAATEIDKLTAEEDDTTIEDIYDDSKAMSLTDDDSGLPFKDNTKKDKKEEEKLELEADPISDENLVNDEEPDIPVKEEEPASTTEENTNTIEPTEELVPDDEISEEIDDEDVELSDEEQKKILNSYKDQIVDSLGLKKINDVEGFAIASKPIKLNNALSNNRIRSTVTWGLQFSGTAIEMTPFSGEELIMLNPQQTKYDTVAGLRTVFSILWRHIASPGKPEFETWLKQISDYDVDCLLFAVYVANFKDTNLVTYECTNKKCKNVFIEKKSIDDMLVYPNDKVKEKFQEILKRDTQGTSLYRTRPVAINDNYAIGFVTQTVYSNLFEPASLTDDFTKKYKPIIDIMPNIDKVYKIDQQSRTLIPITFGKGKNLQETTMRKVKGLIQIMKRFTPDERAIVISEAGKISLTFGQDRIQYQLPEAVCPKCGHKIERQIVTPLDLLFTRAQLPIIAASIQE